MPRSTAPQNFLAPFALIIALGITANAHADYQQTLAAQGADAYSQQPITIEIDNDALANTFANNIVEANPAMSDQEVMIDLNARMQAEQRLEKAAADLDPTAVAEVVSQTTASAQAGPAATQNAAQSTEQQAELESTTAAVASR